MQPIDTTVGVMGYVAITTVGVVYLANGLRTLAEMAMFSGDPGWRGLFWSYFVRFSLPPAVELAAGALLLVYAKPLCARLFRVKRDLRIGGDTTRIVTLIVVGIGFYWLVSGVTIGSQTIAKAVVRFHDQNAISAPQVERIPNIDRIRDIFHPILDLIIGTFLFFRPAWVVRQWGMRVKMPTGE